MSIDQCMRSHTERQLRIWAAWFEKEHNRPSRTDYYLMQICQMLSAKPQPLERYKIPFNFQPRVRRRKRITQQDIDQATLNAKMAWSVRLRGVAVRKHHAGDRT